MAINGDASFTPLRAGFPVCDTVGGLNAAFAVMAALYDRQRTGEGEFIDVALLDSIMPLMGWVVANLMIGAQEPVLMGNDNFTAAPSGVFRTKDGFINIAANKQEQWEAVADVLGVPALKVDARFKERDARKKNRKALTPLLEERLALKETAAWVDALNSRDVPAGAILSLGKALEQPQVAHRETFSTVSVEGIGELKLFNMTAKFSRRQGKVTSPPPLLGEHTEAVLGGLGYTADEIRSLREEHVI
jgi:CoA:oxalate CoA-transferase